MAGLRYKQQGVYSPYLQFLYSQKSPYSYGKIKVNTCEYNWIALSGVFEAKPEDGKVVCDELERKLAEIFYRERENWLIRDNYHFIIDGAFKYSEELHRTIEFFHEVRILTYTMGEPGTNIYRKVVGFAEVSRRQRKI